METRQQELAVLAIEYVKHFIGLPYKWGGDDPVEGFDCSGLAIEMLKSVGILPHIFDDTADGLRKRFPVCGEAKPGVLAFYGTTDRAKHVAICLVKEMVIEAGGGGSGTRTEDDAARYNAYVRIRPVRYRSDFVGYRDPFLLTRR